MSDPDRPLPQRAEHPEAYTARTARERGRAAAWLIHRLGWPYSPAAEQEMGIVCRDFFAAGWTALGLLHAFEQQPDGSEYPGPLPSPRASDRARPVRIHNVWALLTSRLVVWRGEPAGGGRGRPLPPPVPAQTPRRGRPLGAVTLRRRTVEQVERMRLDDPRRAVAVAALRGEPVTVSWRPRSPQAAAEIAALRASLPEGHRKPALRALVNPTEPARAPVLDLP